MKKVIAILVVMILSLVIIRANAQGKGHGHGKGHHKHEWKEERKRSHHRDHDHHVEYRTERIYHYPAYSHYHSRDCGHAIVVHRYERPRYVYYRDYNLYFDHHRNVFISWSGRTWSVSASVPTHLHRVNLGAAAYHEVDYYEDDFVQYLEYGKPMYRCSL
jgi:Ni/Co efflux regulator RcnB